VGLLWFITLLATKNLWFYLAGTAIGIGLSVWLCGAAERILKQTDPSSIVLDEIVAVPVCFLSWVTREWFRQGQLPVLEVFFNSRTWYITLITFALFRLFDIVKPWPIRQSQRLPGGWGVTVDDLLASVYVALLSLIVVR
jgi:phosphatidylglycerophosphatase A